MKPRFIPELAVLLLLSLSTSVLAEIRLPHVISDHAVLQRDAPIHIWGWSDPGEKIIAHFHAQTRATEANKYGEWSLYLLPERAGGPYELTLSGNTESSSMNSASEPAAPASTTATAPPAAAASVGAPATPAGLTISDLLVGDVWFASGQSNMEMPLNGFPGSAVLKNADQEIASANQPQMRLLLVDRKASDVPQADTAATWTLCTPETAAKFSAVAYLFGREISNREHVPVGLIDSTWGGTPVESWISLDGLAADASLMPAFATRARFANEQTRLSAVIAEERREDAAAKAAGQPLPKHPWHPAEISWAPAYLYNSLVAPFTPYSIKGVIWYQGETNSAPERAPQYVRLFPAMISDWRAKWGQGDFPFLFVQISSFDSPGENWGIIRDAQRRTLSLANTGMAVSLDVGERDNVHPPDKQTVAARLVLAARNLAYNEPIEYSGPLFKQATVESMPNGGNGFRIWFTHGAGLNAKGGALRGFEVAGEDKHYVTATATIEGNSVLVNSLIKPPDSSSQVPVYVRYAWAGFSDANLYNQAGLPAPTFTSE
ncbi:MAG TPA: sialate O-acetylesterase [Acidisarcina sp.]